MGSLLGHLFLVVEEDAQLVAHLIIQLVKRVLLLVATDQGGMHAVKVGTCAHIGRVFGATARD